MGLKFVYNGSTYENFLTDANTLSSTWVKNAAAKLFCKGSTYYVPLYESKGENTLAYTDNSTIKQYVNTSSPTLTVYKDKKLYAPKKYSDGTYVHSSYLRKITYNGNSGSTPSVATTSAWTTINSSSVNMTVSSSTSRTGYNFSSWNTNSSGTGTSYTNEKSYSFSSNVTLYAIWKAISYNITYNYDNASRVSASPSKTSYTIEEAVTPAKPTMKAGYSFGSWSPASIAKGSTGAKTFTGSTSINTYTITYNLNGGTLSSNPNPTSYNVETPTITISGTPTFSQKYYTFNKWSPATIAKGSTGNKTVTAIKNYIGPLIDSLTYTTSRTFLSSTNTNYTYTAKYKTYITVKAVIIGQGNASIISDPCYFNNSIIGMGGSGMSWSWSHDSYTESYTLEVAANGNITYTLHARAVLDPTSTTSDTDKKSVSIPITNVSTTKGTGDPVLSSISVSSISYSSWSSWSSWSKMVYSTKDIQYYQRSRTRKWSATATVVMKPNYPQGLRSILIKTNGSSGSTVGSSSTYSECLIPNTTVTKTISVSGSGGDFNSLYAVAYNSSNSMTSCVSTSVSIDAVQYDNMSKQTG